MDLEIKVSVPATGKDLPIILFSHGHGQSNFLSSLRGYGPLVDFYRVAAVQRLTWAYLRTALYPEDPAWEASCTALMESPNPPGRNESK